MFFLVGATIDEILMPGLVGMAIDLLAEAKFDEVKTLCLYMAILVLVSFVATSF